MDNQNQVDNKIRENLYKLYNIKDKRDYKGLTEKCECIINGEYGIFKERMSLRSKDNVMEEVAYRVASLTGVPCAMASCRKHNNVIGSFSRYEIPIGYNFKHLEDIYKVSELDAEQLLNTTIKMCNNSINNVVITMYGYMIFDYILGQRDRHLGNLAVIQNRKTNNIKMYSLYDNGLCCFSTDSDDNAINSLKNRFYSSRLGSSQLIASTINKYRDLIYNQDLRNLVRYDKINAKVLDYYITKADKYKQINKARKLATIEFILRNTQDIHKINMRTFNEEEEQQLYV